MSHCYRPGCERPSSWEVVVHDERNVTWHVDRGVCDGHLKGLLTDVITWNPLAWTEVHGPGWHERMERDGTGL